jgi:hypothetical protein
MRHLACYPEIRRFNYRKCWKGRSTHGLNLRNLSDMMAAAFPQSLKLATDSISPPLLVHSSQSGCMTTPDFSSSLFFLEATLITAFVSCPRAHSRCLLLPLLLSIVSLGLAFGSSAQQYLIPARLNFHFPNHH